MAWEDDARAATRTTPRRWPALGVHLFEQDAYRESARAAARARCKVDARRPLDERKQHAPAAGRHPEVGRTLRARRSACCKGALALPSQRPLRREDALRARQDLRVLGPPRRRRAWRCSRWSSQHAADPDRREGPRNPGRPRQVGRYTACQRRERRGPQRAQRAERSGLAGPLTSAVSAVALSAFLRWTRVLMTHRAAAANPRGLAACDASPD